MIVNYSVLMSVYHREKAENLKESIQSILDQTVPTDDFVIVCDGPLTEELDRVLERFQEKNPRLIRLVRLPVNQGLGPALNQGLRYCRNEIVARMDSDDISLPDRCEKELAQMEQGYDIVSGTVVEFTESIKNLGAKRQLPETDAQIHKFARKRNPFNHPCVMYRKKVVEQVGSYRECYLYEDYHLWVRMLLAGARGYNLPSPLLYMRAGDAMYQRRGGFAYLKAMIAFRTYLRKSGFITRREYIVTVVGHGAVCLMPNKMRTILYKKFLRKE